MFKFIHFFILSIAFTFNLFSQETNLFEQYKDSATYKIVIKTQNFNGTEDIAADNLTIKYKDDETKVYYIRYGDMLISSVTIPYSIIERFIEFEKHVHELKSKQKTSVSILFDDGITQVVIPIDILNEELVNSLMIELREED